VSPESSEAESERETTDGGSGWQLAGASPAAYERYLVPAIMRPWAERLVDAVAPRAGERVLDVACGTGVVAREVASRTGAATPIVGVDVNPAMLAIAREIADEDGHEVEWREGEAGGLPLDDASFDVVLCQHSLMFFPSAADALREMRRVLGEGGRVGLAVWRSIEHNSVYGPLAEALGRHAGQEAEAMVRSIFPDWDADDLRTMVGRAGFEDVAVEEHTETTTYPSASELLRREAASSPLAGPIGAVDDAVRDALVDDLEDALAGFTTPDGLTFPMRAHVVVGRGVGRAGEAPGEG
jgi:ubiquinone/menaquinone biosynthesis C-methylase UbiE